MRRCLVSAATLMLLAACSASGGGAAPSSGPSTPAATSPSAPTPPAPSPSASSTPPPMLVACPSASKRRFAAAASAPVTVDAHAVTGLTTCDYRSPAGSRCTSATLRINTAPQAYIDFHRYVDESAQNATQPEQTGLAPMLVNAPELGREVDWVPAHRQLDTGVPGRWLTVTAHCTAGDVASRALARRLAGTAVGR